MAPEPIAFPAVSSRFRVQAISTHGLGMIAPEASALVYVPILFLTDRPICEKLCHSLASISAGDRRHEFSADLEGECGCGLGMTLMTATMSKLDGEARSRRRATE